MKEVIEALREALEPDPTEVTKYLGRRRPWKWKDNHLYVYPEQHQLRPIETGPVFRFEFAVRAVLIVDTKGEEAQQERYQYIDDAIDAKIADYTHKLRHRTGLPNWLTVQVITVDSTFFDDFDATGVSLLIEGYRHSEEIF